MNARTLMAALAVPCLCVAAEQAIGQDRSAYGPVDPARTAVPGSPPADPNSPRLPVLEERDRARPIEMIEAWKVGGKAEFGLGRFRVGEVARARTHNERVPENLMAKEDKAIAGAGLRIRFD